MDLNLTDYQLRAIGLLSTQWSYLEAEIDFTVSALGSLVENDQRVPHRFKERIKRWRKLARTFYNDPIYQTLDEIITDAKQIHDARCLVLHGRVYRTANQKRGQMILESHRHLDKWHGQAVPLSVSGVLDACESVVSCYNDLTTFNRTHLPTSPHTLPRMHS